jgi:hypothetical protein
MTEVDPRAQLVHQESVRALEMQSATLDELRSRAGVLLAAASVATAFLGAEALKQHGLSTVNTLGAITFICVFGLALWILSPTGGWRFTYNADVLREYYVAKNVSITNMYLSMAEGYAASRVHNRDLLEGRMRLFRFACIALGIDVLLWLAGIRG